MQNATSSSPRNTCTVIMCVYVLMCLESLYCGICKCYGFHIFYQLCLVKRFYFITESHTFPEKDNVISNKDKFSSLCQYLCVTGSK